MRHGVATSTGMVKMIDFTATWCGPCKVMKPVLDSLANEYAGRVELSFVDVDDDRVATAQFDVRSMPTLVFVRDGREVARIVGSRPRGFGAGVLDRGLNGDVAVASP